MRSLLLLLPVERDRLLRFPLEFEPLSWTSCSNLFRSSSISAERGGRSRAEPSPPTRLQLVVDFGPDLRSFGPLLLGGLADSLVEALFLAPHLAGKSATSFSFLLHEPRPPVS